MPADMPTGADGARPHLVVDRPRPKVAGIAVALPSGRGEPYDQTGIGNPIVKWLNGTFNYLIILSGSEIGVQRCWMKHTHVEEGGMTTRGQLIRAYLLLKDRECTPVQTELPPATGHSNDAM